MSKSGNLEHRSPQEPGKQREHEYRQSLDSKRLHGGQGPHKDVEHVRHDDQIGYEHEHHNKIDHEQEQYEYNQHDDTNHGHEQYNDIDYEYEEKRDLAPQVKPNKEGTRVSSLVRDTSEQTDHSFSVEKSESHNDRHDDGSDHEASLPHYEDHEKDTLFEVQEGDHSSFAQWEKEEARRQTEWSEKATNFANDEVHHQLGPDFAEHEIKFDTGVPKQPGQESSEQLEYRAYKDDKGRMIVSDNRLNGTLPENMKIDDTDAKSGLTRVPLEEADPLLKNARPENFSGPSDLQAYRKKGQKEVVVTSPENEHKYKENGDYEHIGSVDLSESQEAKARREYEEKVAETEGPARERVNKYFNSLGKPSDAKFAYYNRRTGILSVTNSPEGLAQEIGEDPNKIGNLRLGQRTGDGHIQRISMYQAADILEGKAYVSRAYHGNYDLGPLDPESQRKVREAGKIWENYLQGRQHYGDNFHPYDSSDPSYNSNGNGHQRQKGFLGRLGDVLNALDKLFHPNGAAPQGDSSGVKKKVNEAIKWGDRFLDNLEKKILREAGEDSGSYGNDNSSSQNDNKSNKSNNAINHQNGPNDNKLDQKRKSMEKEHPHPSAHNQETHLKEKA